MQAQFTPVPQDMPDIENPRYRPFCQEYILDGNGKRSAIAAGYAPKTAEATASRLLRIAKVQEILAELRAAVADRLSLKADDIARRWLDIAQADPNDLTSLTIGACRYCWGVDFNFQWRTTREFNEACQVAIERDQKVQPSDDGGYGYNATRAPNPDCPECDGVGHPITRLGDTTKLKGASRHLFAGVKETKFGIEVKMHDPSAALERLAKHLGMFKDHEAAEAVNSMGLAIAEINRRGSSAPLAADNPEPDEEVEP